MCIINIFLILEWFILKKEILLNGGYGKANSVDLGLHCLPRLINPQTYILNGVYAFFVALNDKKRKMKTTLTINVYYHRVIFTDSRLV